MKLKDQVAIVTGSSYGIGEAVAREFLRNGAKVVINSRDQGRADETAQRLKAEGFEHVLPVAADVADRRQVFQMVEKVIQTWGQVDILVNNAGISAIGDSETLPEDKWNRTIAVNLNGPFWCAQAVAPHMIARRKGNIINVSSILGNVGLHRRAAYVTTKHGLIGLTKVLAVEWAKYNIRVNALCPGYIWTPMETNDAALGISDYTPEDIKRRTPMGRYGTAEEQAKACLWLASDDSSYTTGAVILSDGGWVAYGGW